MAEHVARHIAQGPAATRGLESQTGNVVAQALPGLLRRPGLHEVPGGVERRVVVEQADEQRAAAPTIMRPDPTSAPRISR